MLDDCDSEDLDSETKQLIESKKRPWTVVAFKCKTGPNDTEPCDETLLKYVKENQENFADENVEVC